MKVSIDFTILPLGVDDSIAPYIAECKRIIEGKNLDYELGPNGTAIEGDWEDVFECVRACHEAVHSLGVNRIYSALKVNTRLDRDQSFREKVERVNAEVHTSF